LCYCYQLCIETGDCRFFAPFALTLVPYVC
jgi:hypothetical protein